jgi:hypothetical protein
MKEGAYRAAEKLLVTVASELAGEGSGFAPKCQKRRLNIVVLEGFEFECPVVPSGAVDEDEGEFVSPDRDTIPEGDVDVNDVEVLGDKTVDCLYTRCFGNGSVCAQGQREFAGVEKCAVLGAGDDVFVVAEAATPGQTMELFRSVRSFGLGRVGSIAWADRLKTSVWMMKLRHDFLVRHAFQFEGWTGPGRVGYRWGVMWGCDR